MPSSIDSDVIIIGGGLSGLTAAYFLLKKEPSLNVTILESSERIGGRLVSVPLLVRDGSSVSFFDVNEGLVCDQQTDLWNLLEELDVPVTGSRNPGNIVIEFETRYDIPNKSNILYFLTIFDAVQLTRFILEVEVICHDIKTKRNINWINILSRCTLKNFIKTIVDSRAVKTMIDYMVLMNCGCNSSEISALFYVFFCISTKGIVNQLLTERHNMHEFKLKSSLHDICSKMINEIGQEWILTRNHVLKVNCTNNYVEIVTNLSSYYCYDVIVAVAPRDILEIEFEPALPRLKIHCIEDTCSNVVTSFLATYPREFWRDRGHSGEIYVIDKKFTAGPIDYCRSVGERKKPALQGQIFSRKFIDNENFPSYKKKVLDQLSEYFGEDALYPTDYYETSWFDSTAQMVCWKTGNTNYIEDITQPHQRIYFAGAETSSLWYGYLAGAVNSGLRTALEVLYHIRPSVLTPDDLIFLRPTGRSLGHLRKHENLIFRSLVHWKYNTAIILILLIILYKLKNRFF